MGSMTQLKRQVANYLRNNGDLAGVKLLTAYPAAERDFPLRQATVAVGLAGAELAPGGFGGYWGAEGGAGPPLFGGKVAVTLRLDIYCPMSKGGDGCHSVYELLCDRLLLGGSPFGVSKMWCGEVGYDKAAGANRLTAFATLSGAVAAQEDSVTIGSFTIVQS